MQVILDLLLLKVHTSIASMHLLKVSHFHITSSHITISQIHLVIHRSYSHLSLIISDYLLSNTNTWLKKEVASSLPSMESRVVRVWRLTMLEKKIINFWFFWSHLNLRDYDGLRLVIVGVPFDSFRKLKMSVWSKSMHKIINPFANSFEIILFKIFLHLFDIFF